MTKEETIERIENATDVCNRALDLIKDNGDIVWPFVKREPKQEPEYPEFTEMLAYLISLELMRLTNEPK